MTGKETGTVAMRLIRESEDNEREIQQESIERLANTIDLETFNADIDVWEVDGEFEIIDGHRRYHALKHLGVDGDYKVDVDCLPVENEREALILNIKKDENQEDLKPMEQARKWAKVVDVEVDGEEMSYGEYISELSERVRSVELCIPSEKLSSVKEFADEIEPSSKTVSNRLSLLLYPDDVQDSIDSGKLSKTVARYLPSRCRSVNDTEKGLQLLAELGRFFEGQGGLRTDIDGVSKRDIVGWSIDHTNETGEVAVITEEPPEPEPAPEEQESPEPEQEESDEQEPVGSEEEEPEQETKELETVESVLADKFGEGSIFVEKIEGYVENHDLSITDVVDARDDHNPEHPASFMNQLHIRAGNEEQIHEGPEATDEEDESGNEEQNRGTSESTESGSDDEPEWSDSVSSSDGEDTSPEDSVEEAETDSSDESEESQGESDTEYTPVVQERSMDSTEDSDEELPDTMDPVDILNQPTDEKVRQKAKEAGYETPDDLVEDMYNIEFGSDGKSQTMREAMGEEAFQDFVEFKMDTQQVHREWNEDPLISKVQSHYKSFRNLRDVFEQTPDDMSCPCCGSGTTKLEWSCCGVELGESLERHAEEAEENKSEALERMGQIEDEVRNGVEVESEVNEE